MKALIILTVVAAAQAAGLFNVPVLDSGVSTRFHKQDDFGNYGFGYKEDHLTGGTFREESGDTLGRKIGSYGLTDADGRVRVVSYVADDLGFRAKVDTNEPGVDLLKDPADVLVNKDIPAPVVLPRINPIVDPLTITKVDSFVNPLVGGRVLVDPIVGPKVATVIDPKLAIHHRHHLLGSVVAPRVGPIIDPSLDLYRRHHVGPSTILNPSLDLYRRHHVGPSTILDPTLAFRRHHLLDSVTGPRLAPILDTRVLVDPLVDSKIIIDPLVDRKVLVDPLVGSKVSTVLDHRVTVDPVVVPKVSSLVNKRVIVDPLVDTRLGGIGLIDPIAKIPFSSYGLYNRALPFGYFDYYNKLPLYSKFL